MLAIVLVLFVASASAAYGQTVKIGTATALTGLGALIAKAGVVGMEIAVEDLNKKGGLLGRKVELIVRDSKLRPEIGARELKELILNDKIELAIGPVSSGVGLAMSEVAKEHKVPNTERMTVERGHRYIFKLVPNSDRAYVIDKGAICDAGTTAGILHNETIRRDYLAV